MAAASLARYWRTAPEIDILGNYRLHHFLADSGITARGGGRQAVGKEKRASRKDAGGNGANLGF